MRPILAATLSGALLLTAACGSDDPTTSSSTPAKATATTSPAATPLDEATLKGALLTAADLPSGFIETEPTVDDTPTDPDASDCERFLDELETFGDSAKAKVEAEFEKGEDAGVGHLLVSFADEAAATAELAKVKALVTDCGSFTSDSDGATIKGAITKLGLTGLSPDGVALNATFSFSAPGVPASSFGIDLSAARVGTTLSLVLFGDGGAASVDHKVTERLGALAYSDLKAAAG